MVRVYRDSAIEFGDIEERNRFDNITTQQARDLIGLSDRSVAVAMASRFYEHARTFPFQDVGVAFSLTEAGYSATSPEAYELAGAAAAVQVEESETLQESRWSQVDPGSAMFTDDGTFIGYEDLKQEENDAIVTHAEDAIARGDFNRFQLNSAIQAGQFNPLELLAEIDGATKPYETIFRALMDDETGDLAQGNEVVWGKVRQLPYTRVQEIANDLSDQAARYTNIVDRGEGALTINPDNARRSIESFMGNDQTWQDIEWYTDDDGVGQSNKQVLDAVRQAAIARGEQPFPEKTMDSGGGVIGGVRDVAGFASRGTVSALGFVPQLLTNRFRQNVTNLQTGTQGLIQEGVRGDGRGGEILQQPTLVGDPLPVTPAAMSSLQAGAGISGVMQDAAMFAVPGVGRTGMMARAATMVGTEAIDAHSNPDRWLQRARATDLGTYLEYPELAGDGFLLSPDLMALRRRREAEFSPTINGSLLTFGRAAAGIGVPISFSVRPYSPFTGFLSVSIADDGWAPSPGSVPYNLMSGATDFAVALAGPGEVFGDVAIKGLLSARSLRGIRQIPGIGRIDPLADTGLIQSRWRNALVHADADEWLQSFSGRRVVQRLTEMDRTSAIWRAFRGRIDPELARQIAEETDVERMSRLLRDQIALSPGGRGPMGAVPRLRPTGSLRGTTMAITDRALLARTSAWWNRLSANLPARGSVNTWRLDESFAFTEDFLRNASVPSSVVDNILDDLADTHARGRSRFITERVGGEVYQRTYAAEFTRENANYLRRLRLGSEKAAEEATKRADEFASRLTRFWTDEIDDLRLYHINNAGDDVPNVLTLTDEGAVSLGGVELIIESHHGMMSVPGLDEIRNIRRLNKPLNDFLYQFPMSRMFSEGFNGLTVAASALTGLIWKPAVLLRPAYIMRVVGEEQARIAAAGGDALYNNPMGWLAWVTGTGARRTDIVQAVGQADVRPIADQLGLATGRRATQSIDEVLAKIDDADGVVRSDRLVRDLRRASNEAGEISTRDALRVIQNDITGGTGLDRFSAEYNGAMVGAWQRQGTRRAATSAVYDTARKGQDEIFTTGWGGEISQLASDPIAPRIALEGVTDDFLTEFTQADEWAEARSILRNMVEGDNIVFDPTNREHIAAYFQQIDQRITTKVGESVELREAIATGYFRDVRVAETGVSALQANPEFIGLLDEMIEFAPDRVKVLRHSVRPGSALASENKFRKALDIAASYIIERPTSYLSRSPVFRQNYWNFVADHADDLTPADARRLLDSVPDGLPRDLRRTLTWRLESSVNTNGVFSLEALDFAAKADAMHRTNDLLFSMVTKGQWADSLRVIAPFADAWREIITTWARLIPKNPQTIRRVSQARTVLNDPEFAETVAVIPGFEVVDGQGLSWTNDYGQEVLLVPWANAVNQLIRWGTRRESTIDRLGLPTPPSAVPLQSLNVGASVLPGIGPVAALPLNWFFNELAERAQIDALGADIPGFDVEVRDLVFPFGEPTTAFSAGAVVDEFLPSYVRYGLRLMQGNFEDFGTIEERDQFFGRTMAAAFWLLANRGEEYPLATYGPEVGQRLIADAEAIVLELGVNQLFTAFTGPSPAQPAWLVYDEDNNVMLNVDDPNSGTFLGQVGINNMIRLMREEGLAAGMTYEDAEMAAFMAVIDATAREGAIFAALGKSMVITPTGVPTSKEAYDWLVVNRDAPKKAPQTWGVFAPQAGPEAEFYLPMYLETIDMGDRRRLSNEDWVRLAEDLLGNFLLKQVTDDLDARYPDGYPDEVDIELTLYEADLHDRLPGFQPQLQQLTDLQDAIIEMGQVTAPGSAFAEHELAAPIQEIVTQRQRLQEHAIREGLSTSPTEPFVRSLATQELRQAYDAFLDDVVGYYPQAEDMVNRYFRREISVGLTEDRRREREQEED